MMDNRSGTKSFLLRFCRTSRTLQVIRIGRFQPLMATSPFIDHFGGVKVIQVVMSVGWAFMAMNAQPTDITTWITFTPPK